jgi:hypothetical protein
LGYLKEIFEKKIEKRKKGDEITPFDGRYFFKAWVSAGKKL